MSPDFQDFDEALSYIRSAPDLFESEQMCRSWTAHIARLQSERSTKGLGECATLTEQRRILKGEMSHISRVFTESSWQEAVRTLFGQEARDQCIEWVLEKRRNR